jgi:hypothetical protein
MESNKETKLTPEQKQLLEVTAKWLDLSRTSLLDTKSTEELDWYWNQTNEWIKTYFRQLAASLLAIQQAAGAVLKDSDQKLPKSNYTGVQHYESFSSIEQEEKAMSATMGYEKAQEDMLTARFVKVQPLIGGRER